MGIRDTLEANFDAAASGELETPIEQEIEVNDDPIQEENASHQEGRSQDSDETESHQEADSEEGNDPPRNEKGQFKSRTEEEAAAVDAMGENDAGHEEFETQITRPTTFKKEYLPIWDKMAKGDIKSITPEEAKKFAEYTGSIRENEFKRGVSTYRAEAENAKSLMEAISPFVPELQKQNIHPAAWINNLGRAHMILTSAPYDQKVQLFHRLAQDYGIQLNQGGNDGFNLSEPPQQQAAPDAYTQQLLAQLQQVNQEVSTIKGRYEQEETARLNHMINEVASDTTKYPYFEDLREDMAQLLERGLASDLQTAYAKAVRLRDDIWAKEQNRLLQQAQKESQNKQRIAKAKATAVQTRSVTPNGVVATSDKKDRRSMLESQIDSAISGRV